MVSASYKGMGINVNDVIIIGALAVGAYFLYKSVVKPTSQVTGAVGDTASSLGGLVSGTAKTGEGFIAETGNAGKTVVSEIAETFKAVTDSIQSAFQGSSSPKSGTSALQPKSNSITQVSGTNYVTNVAPSTAFNSVPVVTVSTNTGQSSTVVANPNTYYPTLGIGFNSKGQGYSSFKPL